MSLSVLSLPGDMGVFAETTWKRNKTVFLEWKNNKITRDARELITENYIFNLLCKRVICCGPRITQHTVYPSPKVSPSYYIFKVKSYS